MAGTTISERVMVWHGWEKDPTSDPAAVEVLTAYGAAEKARLPTVDCYVAGVEAWRRAHPVQSAAYAGKQAVTVILAVKGKLRIED
jgi:hypothetical protein